ncbi:MAG: hypothetical protein WC755_03535 [Candidatus Woesearchaeota archaeon]|jgi:hypothetical protein
MNENKEITKKELKKEKDAFDDVLDCLEKYEEGVPKRSECSGFCGCGLEKK